MPRDSTPAPTLSVRPSRAAAPKPSRKPAKATATKAKKDPATLPPGVYTILPGLKLRVAATGVRTWYAVYRLPGVSATRRQMAIGEFPRISKASAVLLAADVRRKAKAGVDPVDARRKLAAHSHDAAGLSFAVVAERWYGRFVGSRSPSWRDNNRRWLDRDILPLIGPRPAASIQRSDVIAVMERSERLLGPRHAHDVRGCMAQVLDYAMDIANLETNVAKSPVKSIVKPKATSHPTPTPAQFGQYLAAVSATQPTLSASVWLALNLLPQTALRVSELVTLRVADLRGLDSDDARLTVPAERLKGGRMENASKEPHVIPLSTQARALFAQAVECAGTSAYLFPGLSAREQTMNKSSLNRAIERLRLPFDCTPHSFRSVFSTQCRENALGSGEEIEKALHHALPSAVQRAYDHSTLLAQRRVLMQRWSNFCDTCEARAVAVEKTVS